MSHHAVHPHQIIDCLVQWVVAYVSGIGVSHLGGLSLRSKTPVDHARDLLVMGLFVIVSLLWNGEAHEVPVLCPSATRPWMKRACAVLSRAVHIGAIVAVSMAFSCIKFIPGTSWTMQDVVSARPHDYGLAEEVMMVVSMGLLVVGVVVTLRAASRVGRPTLHRALFFPLLGLLVISAVRLLVDVAGDSVRCREPSMKSSSTTECHAEWHPHHYQIAWLLAMSVVVRTRLTIIVSYIAWGVFLHGVTVYNADVLV